MIQILQQSDGRYYVERAGERVSPALHTIAACRRFVRFAQRKALSESFGL